MYFRNPLLVPLALECLYHKMHSNILPANYQLFRNVIITMPRHQFTYDNPSDSSQSPITPTNMFSNFDPTTLLQFPDFYKTGPFYKGLGSFEVPYTIESNEVATTFDDDADSEYDIWLDPEVSDTPSKIANIERHVPSLPTCNISLGLDERWGKAEYHSVPQHDLELETSVTHVCERKEAVERMSELKERLDWRSLPGDGVPHEAQHASRQDLGSQRCRVDRSRQFLSVQANNQLHPRSIMAVEVKRRSASSSKTFPSRRHSGSCVKIPESQSSSNRNARNRASASSITSSAFRSWSAVMMEKLATLGHRPGSPTESDDSWACDLARAIERGDDAARRRIGS